jgi:hypothetical protein
MDLSRLPMTSRFSRIVDAPRQLLDGTRRGVRAASPATLEHLLRSPARRLVLDAIFWHAGRQLRGSRPNRSSAIIRCHVIGDRSGEPDTYELRLSDGTCQLTRGAGDTKPHVTIALDDAELVRLLTAQVRPAQEVLGGRIMVRGGVGPLASEIASAFLSQLRE